MATKTFCDICGTLAEPSYRLTIGRGLDVEYIDLCPSCKKKIEKFLKDMKKGKA